MGHPARVGGERVYVPTHRDEAAMNGAAGESGRGKGVRSHPSRGGRDGWGTRQEGAGKGCTVAPIAMRPRWMGHPARVGGERVYVPTHRDEAAMNGAPGTRRFC